MAVPQSGFSTLAKAITSGVGQYEDSQASTMEADQAKAKQAMLAGAIEKYGADDMQGLISDLSQDPSQFDNVIKLMEADKKGKAPISLKKGETLIDPKTFKPIATSLGEGQAPGVRDLSSTEQTEFFKQKEGYDSGIKSIDKLKDVTEIKKRPDGMYSGTGSNLAVMMNRVPGLGLLIDDNAAANTSDYNTALKSLAYDQLKITFPGAISNDERKALESLQAMSNKTPEEQATITASAEKVLKRLVAAKAENMKGIATGKIYSDPTNSGGAAGGGSGSWGIEEIQ